MTTTNFPNGLTSFGMPQLGGGAYPMSGHVFFVSSVASDGGANGNDGGYSSPKLTLAGALSSCVANRGDVVYLMPGFAQTISAAAGATIGVAGVTVIGLGNDADMPEFTFSATGSTFTITAANVTLANVVGLPSVDNVTSGFVISAAGCTLGTPDMPVIWRDASASIEAISAVLTTTDADDLTINLKYEGFTAGNAVARAIELIGVDNARINVDFYGVVSTAVVNFTGTACTNVNVSGYMYVSGVTNFSRSVVDTVTGSTWAATFFDGAAGASVSGGSGGALAADDVAVVAANLLVPAADSTANTAMRDVVGAKDDTTVQTIAATTSLMRYMKGVVNALVGADGVASFPTGIAAANAVNLAEVIRYIQDQVINGTGTALAANTSLYGVLAGATGVPAWPTAAAYANDVSIAEVLGYIQDGTRRGTGSALPANTSINDHLDKVVTNTAAVLANATTIFTVAGGPIEILSLVARCVTSNNCVASTLQWSADPTDGGAATFSGASASLANVTAGAMVILLGTALTTAPTVATTSVGLSFTGATPTNSVIVGAGIITTTIGVGSTTGTWMHHMRYRPLSAGVTVT